MNDFEAAAKIYRNAIAESPRNIIPWRKTGDLCIQQGRIDEAIALCRKELTKNEPNPSPAIQLVNLYAAKWIYSQIVTSLIILEASCLRLMQRGELKTMVSTKFQHTTRRRYKNRIMMPQLCTSEVNFLIGSIIYWSSTARLTPG